MKLIDVSTKRHPGVYARVDDSDFEELSRWKWSAEKRRTGFYAIRAMKRPDGSKTTIRMHVQIMENAREFEVDHRDGDGLNNQRSNLRCATQAQNQWNSRKRTGKTSKFKGVSWCSRFRRWKAHISINGHHKSLGSYRTEEAAAVAYNHAATHMHGPFAQINCGLSMTHDEAVAHRYSSARWNRSSATRFLWPAIDDATASAAVESLLADFGV